MAFSGSGGTLWITDPATGQKVSFGLQQVSMQIPPKTWATVIPYDQIVQGGASFVFSIEKIAHDAARELKGNVYVTVREDHATRGVIVSVHEADMTGGRGFPVADRRTLIEALQTIFLESVRAAPSQSYFKAQYLNQATTTTALATATPLTVADLKAAMDKFKATPPPQQRIWNSAPPVVQPTPLPAPEPFWSPTPVYGFRAWEISYGYYPYTFTDIEGPVLDGTLVGKVTPWNTSMLDATCHETSLSVGAVDAGHAPAEHDAPHWGCHCGVYVTDDPNHNSVRGIDRLLPDYYSYSIAPYAIGVVELTGTVVQHETGARGATGEIKHLWVREVDAPRVEMRYPDVPITAVANNRTAHHHWFVDEDAEKEADTRTVLLNTMYRKKEKLEEPWLK